MYNKTIISFGFGDNQNNQGLGKRYQPKLKTEADVTYLALLNLRFKSWLQEALL